MTNSRYSLQICDTAKTAANKMNGAKGSIWAYIGVFFLVGLACGIITAILNIKEITGIINWIIQLIASGCGTYLGICRAKGQSLQWTMIKDVIKGKTIFHLILATVLQALVYAPPIIVFILTGIIHTASGSESSFFSIWSLLTLVVAIAMTYIYIRLLLTIGFIVDKHLNAWAALVASFKATKGNVCNLIGVYILVTLTLTACIITLGIGFIWGIPFLAILHGEVYVRLSNAHPEIATSVATTN